MSLPSAISRSTLAATLLILLAGACADSSPPVDPIAALPGRINLSILATGGDIDDNGFVIAVGSGALRQVISVVAMTASFDFAAGTHSVLLENISPNCSVTGENPRSVTVVTGATTDVNFALACEATGITVTSRTTGFNMPPNYELVVGANLRRVPVPANGSAIVTRLPTGVHTVTLVAGEHCTVAGGRSVTVEVVNRIVTPLAFEVDCGAVTIRAEKIAYTSITGERLTVGVVRPDGTFPTELSEGHSPTWSRDGAQLLFSKMVCSYDQSYNSEMCSGSLAIVDPETHAVTTVPNSVAATDPAWSPATNEIAFTRCCERGDWARLYLMRMDGLASGSPAVPIVFQPTNFFTSGINHPAWSPDGQRIAFTCYVAPSTDICVVKRDGTGLVRLTTGSDYESAPAWSPDGRTIAFTSWSATSGGHPATVSVIAAEGGPITSLTLGARPAWSRDGKMLVFDHANVLHTMDANGTNVKQLLPANRYDAAWRP